MPTAAPMLPRINSNRSRPAYAALNDSMLSLCAFDRTLTAVKGTANANSCNISRTN